MAQLAIRLFSHPQIELDSKPASVDTRKAVALLAYLALSGQSHSRESLAGLLWPEYDHASARAALRRTLSVLNKAAGEGHITAGRDTITLVRDSDLWVDVWEFRSRLSECAVHGHPATSVCPACTFALQSAVDLYRGDFMEGFSLRDSAVFDEWQFMEAENLRRELAGALERLSHCLSQAGQQGAAIDAARRWLAQDELREEAHRHLMLLYARSGQHGAALRQYRECVRVLDQELGVAPLDETTRLYQDILEHRIPPAQGTQLAPAAKEPEIHPHPAFSAAKHTPYPVGRAGQWAILQQALNNRLGQWIALQGEAGVGKTYLAEAFTNLARVSGSITASGRCYAGETDLAYSPFLDAIRSRLAQPGAMDVLREMPKAWLAEIAWLLPELMRMAPDIPARPPAEGPAAQSRFFESLRQLLLALLSGSQPGLLVLDDLHLADPAALEFLTYLVRRLKGQPLIVLGIWVNDGSAAVQQLHQLTAETARSAISTLLTLERLSSEEVAQLAVEIAGGADRLPTVILDRLQAEAEGLPYFVGEYLSAYLEGRLGDAAGDWAIPMGVRDLLHVRLADVDGASLQLLATAAVIGRSFDFNSLQEVSGRSEVETIDGLEGLVARGLIREEDPAQTGKPGGPVRYDFNHEKLRALVYEETSLARRRLLHRRVAEVLVNQARSPLAASQYASQIAFHYRMAGQDSKSAEYYAAAGEHARRLHANGDALAHFQAALALGHPDAAGLREKIGDLQTLKGDYAAALASYETTASQYCGECLPRLEHKLGNVHARRGAWEIAESHYASALEALDENQDPGLCSQIYGDRSQVAYQHGQTERAQEFAQRAVGLAENAGDWQALAQSYNLLGILARSAGQIDQAHANLTRSLEAADCIEAVGPRIAALNNLALLHSDMGEVEEAIRLGQSALDLCVEQGDRHHEAALRNHLADFHHELGQTQLALQQLEKAVAIFAEIGWEDGETRPEIWMLSEW